MCRELVFFVWQYLPPASFFTVQIRVLRVGVNEEAEGEQDWCAFFPVTRVSLSASQCAREGTI